MEFAVEISLILIIILLGLAAIANAKTIIRTVLFINIMQTGIFTLFLALVYRPELLPPILPVRPELMVDPTPSALVITAIVIGASVTALALMMSMKVFYHFGTVNWKKISERQGQ